MSPEIGTLIVDLTHRVQAAFDEADEARAEARAMREQRNIALQHAHDLGREVKRQKARLEALCEENRQLRADRAEWQQVAA